MTSREQAEGKVTVLLTEIGDKAMDLFNVLGGLQSIISPDDMNADSLEGRRASGLYSFFRPLRMEVSNILVLLSTVEERRAESLQAERDAGVPVVK